MRTPAGKECKHYYEDYHRGANTQECRLIQGNMDSLPWHPSDCKRCPVPDILYANASPDLLLKLTVDTRLMGLGRKLIVEASCLRHKCEIADPYVGCLYCNEERGKGLDLFRQALEGDDD
ncbi:MAG: hypothetical protein AAF787_22710 [Chloroflexota bacterium]